MDSETATDEETAAWDGSCDEHGLIPSFPPREFDEEGRLIPEPPEIRKARSGATRRMLAVLKNLPDDDLPGIEAKFIKGIDDNREQRQKVFEGWGAVLMALLVLLDSGPLGLACSGWGLPLVKQCRD